MWLREPGILGDSRNTEFLVTVGSKSRNPEFRVTPGTRSSGWLREPGVPVTPQAGVQADSGNQTRESGVPGDYGNLGFRWPLNPVPFWLREPGVRVTLWTRISGWLLETGVQGDSGNRIQEPEDPGDSWNPEFRVTPVTSSSEWLWNLELRVTPESQEFRVTPRTRSSGLLREPSPRVTRKSGFPGLSVPKSPGIPGCDSMNPEFWVTPGIKPWNLEFQMARLSRSSGWLREPVFPSDSGNQEILVTPGTRCFWWPRNAEFSVPTGTKSGNPEFRVSPGTESWNPEFRVAPETRFSESRETPEVTPGTRRSGWLREQACKQASKQ